MSILRGAALVFSNLSGLLFRLAKAAPAFNTCGRPADTAARSHIFILRPVAPAPGAFLLES